MKLEEWHLKALCDWFKSIDVVEKFDYSDRVQNFTSFSGGNMRYRTFAYLIDLLEKNGFPTVLSDQKFEELPEPMFYRGVKDINYNASTLADYDYHKGDGSFALGIHATQDNSLAEFFSSKRHVDKSEEEEPNDNSDIVKFKPDSDTKYIYLGLLGIIRHELRDYAEKKNVTRATSHRTYLTKKDYEESYSYGSKRELLTNLSTLKKFIRYIYKNQFDLYITIISSNTIVALLLGFDAIEINEDHNQFSILNRGKMIVSESEFKRITDASKNYKGGVIDFDSKTDDEFLRE